MTFLERMEAVLHGRRPDRVPFAPYDVLVPRGDFERELRNRGMGLCLRRRGVWSETPEVRVEHNTEGELAYTLYHTPVGTVRTGRRTHVGRISDGETVECEWAIKSPQDYQPVIFMIENTRYHRDYQSYLGHARDVGADGIVRLHGPVPPYDSAATYFSLQDWAVAEHEHSEPFDRLLRALERDVEKLMPHLLEAPAEFVSMGSLSGIYGPRQYREQVLPFYARYVPELLAAGKIPALHAHNSNLSQFADLIKETRCPVVEAFTPPPVGDLSLAAARRAWGREVVVWVNFPETIFLLGEGKAYEYTADLLRQDGESGRLVIGMTEMGTYGVTDDESERVFKRGMREIMDAIDDHGVYQ